MTEPELRRDADAVTRLGVDVRRLVVDPALDMDVDGLTLLVAPASRLWAVPFDALPDDRGGWLIDACQEVPAPTR